MRVSKIFGFLLIAILTVGFVACKNTVSSTDASEDEMIYIPGFEPSRTLSSKVNDESSSSQALSSDAESSATEESSSSGEESSSSEEVSSSSVDFSESNIQVDETGVAVITEEYLEEVPSSKVLELDDLWDKSQDGDVDGFVESGTRVFAVDDLDFSKSHYYCLTQSQEWYEITKEKLLETRLPFLWEGAAYELRDNYSLNFKMICNSICIQTN